MSKSGVRHRREQRAIAGALLALALLALTAAPAIVARPDRSQQRALSADQRLVLDSLGSPGYFVASAVPDLLLDVGAAPSYDVWVYPDLGFSFTFMNGTFAGGDDTEPRPAGARVPAVRPDAIDMGIGPGQLEATLGSQAVARVPLPPTIVAHGEMLVFPGIIAGFLNGALVYFETSSFSADEPAAAPEAAGRRSTSSIAVTMRAILGRAVPPAAAAPRAQGTGVLETAWSGWTVYNRTSNAIKAFSLAGLQLELDGSATFLDGEAQRLGQEATQLDPSDPVRAAQLRQAAARAQSAANGLRNDLLPELKKEEKLSALSWIPGGGLIFGGPNPQRLMELVAQWTRDRTGRDGQLSASLREWLDTKTGDWRMLPPHERESVLTDLLRGLQRRCEAEAPARGRDPAECGDTARNDLNRVVTNQSGYALEDCLTFLRGGRRPMVPEHAPLRLITHRVAEALGVTGLAHAQAPTCPTRFGREPIATSVLPSSPPTTATTTPLPTPTPPPPPPSPSPPAPPSPSTPPSTPPLRVSITTDKTSYRVGDAITICITVSEAGRARLIDKTPAGESEISNGPVPAGMTCTSGTIAPPAGTECVRLEFFAPAGAVVSAEACFQVMGAATPAASAPPAAAATPCTWTGTWRSQAEPDLVLTQSGAQVTGTFGFRGRVQGTVAGDMLTGSVTNAQGQVTQLSFRMSASIDVFTGQFRPTSTPCQVMAGTVGTLPRDFTRR